MAGGGGGEATNEYSPTWVFAVVYTVIVALSFGVERLLYYGGVLLKDVDTIAFYEALQKIKEELMLLGFISLLLTLSEEWIIKICVSPDLIRHMLPCWRRNNNNNNNNNNSGTVRRLLAAAAGGPASDGNFGYCANKGKVPLISVKAIHDLHIFIFTLAVVHVIYCVLTVLIGRLKIRQWKPWEDSVAEENHETNEANWIAAVPQPRSTHVLMVWLYSFWKQFYGSVNKSDYVTLRYRFIMAHKLEDPKFNFRQYMIEVIKNDFIHVFGISWYLWVFVVIFFMLDVDGWYTYFWMAFIPFLLLLAVGTNLEHVLIRFVHDNESPHFWFHQPSFVLFLIHFILFQNSFDIAFFFWIWLKAAYSFDACVMGELSYIVFRLVIGVVILVLCSFHMLPLYALLRQMGDHYNKKIFEKHVHHHGQSSKKWLEMASKT